MLGEHAYLQTVDVGGILPVIRAEPERVVVQPSESDGTDEYRPQDVLIPEHIEEHGRDAHATLQSDGGKIPS